MIIKSNRKFIIKIFLPLSIIFGFFLLLMTAALIINFEKMRGSLLIWIICVVLEIIVVGVTLFAKYYNGRSYDFTESKITIYQRRKFLREIQVTDIEKILFFTFKFHYLITILAGALNEGGVWKLHLFLKDGTKQELAFFALDDVNKLKGIYNDLIKIV